MDYGSHAQDILEDVCLHLPISNIIFDFSVGHIKFPDPF